MGTIRITVPYRESRYVMFALNFMNRETISLSSVSYILMAVTRKGDLHNSIIVW